MADPPFGFGMPGGSGSSGGRGGSGGSGGSGGGSGDNPPGGNPLGPLGDPQQFADALRQFADLMAWQGGPVNWDLAKNVARQTVAAEGDPSVLDADRKKIVEAVQLADLWLNEATQFPSGVRTVAGLEPVGMGRGHAARVDHALRPDRRQGRRCPGRDDQR